MRVERTVNEALKRRYRQRVQDAIDTMINGGEIVNISSKYDNVLPETIRYAVVYIWVERDPRGESEWRETIFKSRVN